MSETVLGTFVPEIRLFTETHAVNVGDVLTPREELRPLPLATLTFDYGGTRVRCSDRRRSFFRSEESGLVSVLRDAKAEQAALATLERYGLVELSCLEDYAAIDEHAADYLIDVDSDVDALVTFSAEVIPKLRDGGWRVSVDGSYQCQLVSGGEPRWYAELGEVAEAGWFNLELGILIDGERVSLLPFILDVLHENPSRFELDALASSRKRLLGIPVGNNRYVPVPPKRLRAILEVLVELYDSETRRASKLALPLCAAAGLGALRHSFDDAEMDWQGEAPEGPPSPLREQTEPAGLQATLRPYQRDGVAWLQGLRQAERGGILADDMGLGKTLQTIAHLLAEKRGGRADRPSLIVAPTSLLDNWRDEMERFAPALRVLILRGTSRRDNWGRLLTYDVVLTSYPLLVRDVDYLASTSFHYVVLDEAQAIKNATSQTHRAAQQLRARHRLCLSGTPLENNLGELWALFDFASPGFLGSAESFRRLFRHPIERDGSTGRLEALRERVRPYILRRMKDTVAKELPPKTHMVRRVEMDGAQRDLYESIRIAAHEKVRSVIRERGLAQSTVDILDALLKLRQVCCDPRLVRVDSARKVRESAKLELLMEMLPEMLGQGSRVLVFSQFTRMLDLIGKGLEAVRVPYALLTGSTRDRAAPVKRFQAGEVPVFLISLKAGGTGLNLTAADTVIHYDPWWNPAAQAQATDRAYRIGQTRPVFVYNLIASGSVEERILGLQRHKHELATGILGSGRAQLSVQEVDDLFAPLGANASATMVAAQRASRRIG